MKNIDRLNTIPNIAYPYKVIYSYFANYRNLLDYNRIKNAVLGINDYNNKYHEYYMFYSIVFSNHNYENIEYFLPFFEICFNKKLSERAFNILKNAFNQSKELFKITFLFNNIESLDEEEGFFLYMIMQRIINKHYKSLIVIPSNLLQNSKVTADFYTLSYYVNGVLMNRIEHLKRGLLKDIQKSYLRDKSQIIDKNMIKHLYVFGSVKENEYHRESDIDMVIEFNECTYEEKKKAMQNIVSYNYETFRRKSDVQEYGDFMEMNPHIELKRIV